MSEPNRAGWSGVWHLWPAFAAIGVHFALRQMLDPWLNASSDIKFWGAVVLLAIPLVFAFFAFFRAIFPSRRR
jgi:hypothetical protein